jgi:hypothetical protein
LVLAKEIGQRDVRETGREPNAEHDQRSWHVFATAGGHKPRRLGLNP